MTEKIIDMRGVSSFEGLKFTEMGKGPKGFATKVEMSKRNIYYILIDNGKILSFYNQYGMVAYCRSNDCERISQIFDSL